MSVCYRCHGDDIYGSRWRGTKSAPQTLHWICADCKEQDGDIIKFSGQGRFYAVLGVVLVALLLLFTLLAVI